MPTATFCARQLFISVEKNGKAASKVEFRKEESAIKQKTSFSMPIVFG